MSATDSAIRAVLSSSSGLCIPCELKRHLSPGTVGLIARRLPLSGNAHRLGDSITYFETGLASGIERPRTEFRRGEIVFYPAEGSVCFVHDTTESARAMTPIGRMPGYEGGLELVGAGDVLTLSARA